MTVPMGVISTKASRNSMYLRVENLARRNALPRASPSKPCKAGSWSDTLLCTGVGELPSGRIVASQHSRSQAGRGLQGRLMECEHDHLRASIGGVTSAAW